MSILSILPLVQDFNKDKPNSIGVNTVHELTDEDWKKINAVTTALLKLNPPYNVEVTVFESSKQMYLKCTDRPKTEAKTVSLPNIYKGLNKV